MISDLNIVIPQSDNLPFVDLFLIQNLIEIVVLQARTHNERFIKPFSRDSRDSESSFPDCGNPLFLHIRTEQDQKM